MELNGVNSYYTGYASTASQTNKDNKTSGTASANNYSDTAATYESSKGQTVSSATSKSTNPSLVAQLKADSDNRMQQLQSLVSKMFEKQGITIGTADDMWKVLASGNFTADADTIAKAKDAKDESRCRKRL